MDTIKDFSDWLDEQRKNYTPNQNNRMRESWLNVTYPFILQNKIVYWFWKKVFCLSGFHLFDEVQSVDDHYLSCDACGFLVHISKNNEPLPNEEENND